MHRFNQQMRSLLDMWNRLPLLENQPETVWSELQERLVEQLQQKENGGVLQNTYEILVEHNVQGLALLQNFHLIYANPTLSQITGYSEEQLRTLSSEFVQTALVFQNRTEAWLQFVQYLADKRLPPRIELSFPQDEGSHRWAVIYAKSILFQDKPAVLITCIDTTEQKNNEIERHNLYANFELEVQEKHQDLATLNGSLQAEVTERRHTQKALQAANDQLEDRVGQRTDELAAVNRALKKEISERKKAEEALKRSEAMFRSLSENASDIVSVIADDGTVRYQSPSIKRLLGYKPEEIIDQNVYDYIHPVDAERVKETIRAVLEDTSLVHAVEFRFRHKDGSWRIFESIGKNLLHNPVINGLVVNSRDITRRRKVEDEKLRLLQKVQMQHQQLQILASRRQQLAQKVVTTQEEERHRVSRELHDEAGQALTALKVSLEILLSRIVSSSYDEHTARHIRHELEGALRLCKSTSAHIRALARDLRPAALDDLGLDLALEGFCSEFAERTHLTIIYSGVDSLEVQDEIAICLYRTLQEGLTNVVKHAYARQVVVRLFQNNDDVVLTIADDGVGFSLHEAHLVDKHQGIGLIGIQERLESLGGSFKIEPEVGIGTQLIATMPMTKRNGENATTK